jgi:Restriction endonuclease
VWCYWWSRPLARIVSHWWVRRKNCFANDGTVFSHLPLAAGLVGSELARWKRSRGYELEKLIVALARLEKLDAEPSYRGDGEQIDGYFTMDYRHFLLEAKWRGLPVTASDVFAFQGKLRGKLLGTLGLFVSISGFAEDAPSALVFGKEIDVLLADRSDIQIALESTRTFQEMVRVKMREAARTGKVYYTYQRWLDMNP